MSVENFNTANYIAGNNPVSAEPLTMACFFYSTSATANQSLITLNQGGSNSNYFGLGINGSVGGDPVYGYVNGSGAGNVNFNTTTGYTANTWHHACAVFTSSSSRDSYIDAGSVGSSTTARTVVSIDRLRLGVYHGLGSPSSPLIGRMAEAAVWNAALTVAEIASLSKGMQPNQIRPQSLVFYAPLIRDIMDVRNGLALTTSGLTVAVHPRIY